MKNIFSTSILAILALAIAGCSSSSRMASTEKDDMYFSKTDRTRVADTRSASPSVYADESEYAGDATNPEYGTGNSSSSASSRNNARASNSDEYYTDNYDYYYSSRIRRFHNPSVGMGYYDPFFTDYYWYNPRAAYFGSIYSGYFYTSPWGYDPFFMPRPWGMRPGIYMSFGYGWGNPYMMGWGNPYMMGMGWGNPYMMGWGGMGMHNPYMSGYYHGFYDGNVGIGGRSATQYGRRGDRSSTAGNYGGGSVGSGRGVGNIGGREATPASAAPVRGAGNTSGRVAAPATQPNATPAPVRGARLAPDNTYQPAPRVNQAASPGRNTTGGVRQPAAGHTETVRPGSGVEYQPAPNPRGTGSESVRPGAIESAPAPSRGNQMPATSPATEPAPGRVAPEPAPRRGGLFRGGNRREASPAPAPNIRNQPAPSRSQPSFSSPSPSRGGMPSGGSAPSGGGARPRR